MFFWIIADSFPIFLASRIVGGLTEGNVQMSIAMITDLTDESERSKTLAWVGICFATAFTVWVIIKIRLGHHLVHILRILM